MNNDKTQALATYLLALSILQQTNRTYVNHEISKALENIERELDLK